jgi:multiple antibiotic resistance protein
MSAGLAFFSVCFPSMFSIVDPIGVVPMYLGLASSEPESEQAGIVTRAVITATVVLLVFAATGMAVFRFFGITIPAFKLAGGVLLATMSLEMMRAQKSTVRATPDDAANVVAKDDIAITPIGIPLLSGPGAIANVIVWASRAGMLEEKVALYVSIALVMILTLVTLRFGARLMRLFGKTGISVVTRIMGLILAATAAQFVVDGWKEAMAS